MSIFFKRLATDEHGSPAVEFALAVPVFIALVIGIFQLGILYLANAGLQQAVEVGARYATLYPRPSDAQISAKVSTSGYGMKLAQTGAPKIIRGSNNGISYVEISMDYTLQPDFIFFQIAPIRLNHTRRAYQV